MSSIFDGLKITFVTRDICLEESVLHQHLQQPYHSRDGAPGQRGSGAHTEGGKIGELCTLNNFTGHFRFLGSGESMRTTLVDLSTIWTRLNTEC